MRRQEIEDMKGQVVSEITVGVTPVTALLAPLKQVLLAFQQKHPEVMLRILEMRPTQLLQHLRDGLLDFALTSQLPASTVGLDWQPLCRLAGVVVVRKDHPLRHVKSLRQLQQATWISVDPLSDAQSQFNQLFQGSALARPRQVIECTAMNLAVKMLIDSDAVMPISEPALGHDLVGLSDMSKHFHTVQVQEPIPDYFINLVCINRSYLTTTASLLHGLLRQSLETATQQP